MSYEVKLNGDLAELIDGADGYVQEGPLTTFFQARDGRTGLDSWARRLASFRTAGVVCVHWEPAGVGAAGGTVVRSVSGDAHIGVA